MKTSTKAWYVNMTCCYGQVGLGPNVYNTSNKVSNDSNVGAMYEKRWKICKQYRKRNHIENNCFKRCNYLSKENKKHFNGQ